jgi:hypothetical protein
MDFEKKTGHRFGGNGVRGLMGGWHRFSFNNVIFPPRLVPTRVWDFCQENFPSFLVENTSFLLHGDINFNSEQQGSI